MGERVGARVMKSCDISRTEEDLGFLRLGLEQGIFTCNDAGGADW